MSQKYVITIARQFGSLGRPIAKRISEILGIEYYDRDIVEKASKIMNLPISIVSNYGENLAKTSFLNMLFPLGNDSSDLQNKIFEVQRDIILNIADKESCIIVGRCSDYILESVPNHLSIFIYAPYEARYYNCINSLHMDPEEAKKMICEVDKARDAYHLKYSKHLPSDIKHKNLLIDSSLFGIDGSAECLANLIKYKFSL